FWLTPTAFEQVALEIERAFDEVGGVVEAFHPLRPVFVGDDHLVPLAFAATFAPDFAPHLPAGALENPQHVRLLYRKHSSTSAWFLHIFVVARSDTELHNVREAGVN